MSIPFVPATLFQYVIILDPTQEEADRGEIGKVVASNPAILAKTKAHAEILANKAVPDELMPFSDRLRVVVRPF